MDENTKKDLARKLKNAFSIAETRAKRIQEIKEAKAKVNLMKKDNSNKPNYKKIQVLKNELKNKKLIA